MTTYRAYSFDAKQFASLNPEARIRHAVTQAAATTTAVVNPAQQAEVAGVTVIADSRVPLGVVWVALDETGGEA